MVSDRARIPVTTVVAESKRAGGIEVIHTPGHCAVQVALLWRPGRMLFAGDVCTNLMGLGDPVGFETFVEGRASQRKLASLSP
jgi:glyoxylase-like metal-dependent hydrolase (beta-lactamase superfamily II)